MNGPSFTLSWRQKRVGSLVIVAFLSLGAASHLSGNEWDTTLARGETREIKFTTDEGTWMSVDISPDRQFLVFDLLGHVYQVPRGGGEATCLTQESGVAINIHPRYSPDGSEIAFVSDRNGQNSLWVMKADGSEPRPVATDPTARFSQPAWAPDGRYIVARRDGIGDRTRPATSGLWMFHTGGAAAGVELVGSDVPGADWPSFSPDGQYLYFHRVEGPPVPIGHRDALAGFHQIRRLNLVTGNIVAVTSGTAHQYVRMSSGGGYAAEPSPDGRWLAFARRIADGTISWKGHRMGPRTALWLRDLHTGAERVVMDPIELDMAEGMKTLRVLPGYAWTPDSDGIIIAQGGKLRALAVESGIVETVPVTALVHRTISEQARAELRISDGSFRARFLRWHTSSTDGRTVAFQALGRIWTQPLPSGTPRRLTEDFPFFEFTPAWSPDGSEIAFVSWSDDEGGQLWSVSSAGGKPRQLTTAPGEYFHPIWSPDGSELLVTRGSGSAARGRNWVANPWYELLRVPAAGGDAVSIAVVPTPSSNIFATFRGAVVRGSWGPDNRIYYPETGVEASGGRGLPTTRLVSVDASNGASRRTHLTFPFADEVVVSPDGGHVAFQEGDQVFLVPLPHGTGNQAVGIDKRHGALPVRPLSTTGGFGPRWVGKDIVEFGSGPHYLVHDVLEDETRSYEITLEAPRRVVEGVLALRGARIVTLGSQGVIERGDVVVDGARLACVGGCETWQADLEIDVSGRTVVPGFVDMHAHHHNEHKGVIPRRSFENATYLAYGVTTTLDNSMWSQNVFPTAELIEAGLLTGPRTFSTGDPLYGGDGPRHNDLASYQVTEAEVARLTSWGAVALKQYQQPRREQRQWISDIARRRGLMVTAEGYDLAYNLGLIMDGHTGWEHPLSYVPLYSDVARFFGSARAAYSPTFVVNGPGPWNEEFFFQESEVWKDVKQRRWLPWRQLIPHTRRRMLRPTTDYSYPMIAQGLADIVAAGGLGAIGAHGQQHGIGSHWEIWMAAAGMGELNALRVASLDGARFLGAERDIGSLEPGKLADLLVLRTNPLLDIRRTLDMELVMKGGVLYDADTLDEQWPEAREFGEQGWVNPEALRSDDRPVQ